MCTDLLKKGFSNLAKSVKCSKGSSEMSKKPTIFRFSDDFKNILYWFQLYFLKNFMLDTQRDGCRF